MSSATPSRLPRFGSKLQTFSSRKKDDAPPTSTSSQQSKKHLSTPVKPSPHAAGSSISGKSSSLFSRFSKKPPPTHDKSSPLSRTISTATRSSPLSEKPLPSTPIAQIVTQEPGRTLLDASELPVPLSTDDPNQQKEWTPLSPTRQVCNPVWDFAIPQPPPQNPDRKLKKNPSYHELKRKASQFVGLKVSADKSAPPLPPLPSGLPAGVPAIVSNNTYSTTTVVSHEPSNPSATNASSASSPIPGTQATQPNPEAFTPLLPRSRLITPTAVPRSKISRASSPVSIASGGSRLSATRSSSSSTGVTRPAGAVRPTITLRNVSSSTGVVQQAPVIQPRTSSLLPSPALSTTDARPMVFTSSLPNPSVRPLTPSRLSPSSRGRVPVIPTQTYHSEIRTSNSDDPYAPALALAATGPATRAHMLSVPALITPAASSASAASNSSDPTPPVTASRAPDPSVLAVNISAASAQSTITSTTTSVQLALHDGASVSDTSAPGIPVPSAASVALGTLLSPLITPTRPFSSPYHAARASRASQRSRNARMLAGSHSTTAPGLSRMASGSHENSLPKNPSPLRVASIVEPPEVPPKDEKPEPVAQACAGRSELPCPIRTPPLVLSSCEHPTAAAKTEMARQPPSVSPSLEQSITALVNSLPPGKRSKCQELLKKVEIASANFIEMEEKAMKAEDYAKFARMTADAAQKVHAKLNSEIDRLISRYKNE